MEFDQLRNFEAFYREGCKQKGKNFANSLEIALRYRDSLTKENGQLIPEAEQTSLASKGTEPSTKTSKSTLKATSFKINEENKTVENKKSNLLKRKPEGLDGSKITKQHKKVLKEKDCNTQKQVIKQLPTTEASQTESTMIKSSSADLSGIAVNENMSVSSIPLLTHSFAEKLTLIRDQRSQLDSQAIILIYQSILAFCEYCMKRNDQQLKALVKLRLGSYLTVIHHLLLDIDDRQSQHYESLMENLSRLIKYARDKALCFVN